jgi:pimeloyl-ACP methyl ester carboxylesterase
MGSLTADRHSRPAVKLMVPEIVSYSEDASEKGIEMMVGKRSTLHGAFRRITTGDVTLRVLVAGQGPLIILLHGFPQCWYLWRHQVPTLVGAGYRVAVPDQRGYGGSDKPAAAEEYSAIELIADTLAIADALGHEMFSLVTHDYGAVLGWDIALLHPERVRAVFALSVPPSRRQGIPRRHNDSGDAFLHYRYFQQPGVAEKELDADVRRSLRMLHHAMSGDAPAGLFMKPRPAGGGILDGLIDPDPLPAWLTDHDLDVYAAAYCDGFLGPINWYRGYRRSDDVVAAKVGHQPMITVPCHLVVGARDASRILLADQFADVPSHVADLRGDVVLDGAGHWLPLERTKEVNSLLLEFLREVHGR